MPHHSLTDTLRQRGHRLTPQRDMIINAIARSEQHLTAEEIFEAVHAQSPVVNVATVYRTLNFLFEEGLICRTALADGQIVYTSAQHGPHIHLVCQRCQHGIEADDGSLLALLGERLLQQYNFSADLHHLSIFGVCAGCKSDR